MASHSLAIAKASLAAALIRPDPSSIPREKINAWHGLLDAVLDRCSPANIQRCKQWILTHTLGSAAKVSAMGKYLVALSGSFAKESKLEAAAPGQGRPAAPRKKQLHILYLFNDLLHDCKYHQGDGNFELLTEGIQKHVVDVVAHAAAHDRNAFPRHQQKLADLVKLWGRHEYFEPSYIQDLENVAADPDAVMVEQVEQDQKQDSRQKASQEMPFVMPTTHGDPSAPYFELPAANMMPHIIPNSKTPIDPRRMKALQFAQGPADRDLISAVKGFLREADMIYGLPVDEDDEFSFRMDELGQTLYVDKLTGDAVGGESYYGWSKKLCERMKGKTPIDRDRSNSRSHSPSRIQRKRRQSMSSGRSRSRSLSRSPRPRFGRGNGSRSRSPHRPRFDPMRRSSSRSRSRRRDSRSPPPRREDGRLMDRAPQPQFPSRQQQANPSGQPFQFPFAGGFPLGPDGRPVPPPRPLNWTGPWPPAPPPAGAAGMHVPGLAPPPPPPNSGGQPPLPWMHGPAQYGQGSGFQSGPRR